MNKPKNQFPFKIIVSYLVIGSLAVVMSYFLYAEYKDYIEDTGTGEETEKIIETGTLINDVYETDSFSRIALLTRKQEDFKRYQEKSDSLLGKIDELKSLIENPAQQLQLDSVKVLLEQKIDNIKQLRLLKAAIDKDTSLDDILKEFKHFDKSIGRINIEDLTTKKNMSRSERKRWQKYVDYQNEISGFQSDSVQSLTIDSLLKVSRYIVLEAKRENSITRSALQEKENELLQNELSVSSKLRKMISDFDIEVNKNRYLETQERFASEERAKNILRIAGIVGILVILFFSYIIVTDFFKAEKFKRHLEEEKQYSENLLKTRDQLMATVSHDLKTPLNTIVGYSELFTHTSLSEKQKTYAHQIASSALFISKMTDDLLDFSKLEAGKLSIEKVPFSLGNLLHQITKAAKDLHSEKQVELQLYIDPLLKGKVFESDPLRIRQIVNNLVSNAYKFTEEGRIQITANVTKDRNQILNVEIAVTDSGIGISHEKQQLIFKEFTQAEADTFKKFGGSGLGLAISRKIAELLHGSLEVESTIDVGSTFFFNIPLKISSSKLPSSPQIVNTEPLNSLKALVFDDDPAMLALLKELFSQMHISAVGYENFEDFKSNGTIEFDFILTDIEMPEHNGFDILESAQKGEIPKFTNQPVIAMTGAKHITRHQYLEQGFTDMLQKPFSKNELVAALSPLFVDRIKATQQKEPKIENLHSDICDVSLLRSFLNSPESMHEVLHVFYEQSAKDLSILKKLADQKDFESLSNVAHRMLTMCRQLNAKRVCPILETLENGKDNSQIETQIKSLLKELSSEMKILIKTLKSNH